MTLSLFSDRCQGRIVRILGGGTLARECGNCLRRTDLPADMQRVTWMQPPVLKAWEWECPSYIGPEVTA